MVFTKPQSVTLSVVIGVVISIGVLSLTDTASARAMSISAVEEVFSPVPDNAELVRIAARYDTVGTPGKEEDLAAVRMLYRQNALATPQDFLRAATVLGNSTKKDDALLASELSLAALAKGLKSAAPIAAWSHDRYLVTSGQNQRFGTVRNGKSLLPVAKDVTDLHRKALGLPSLADAKSGRSLSIPKHSAPVAAVLVD